MSGAPLYLGRARPVTGGVAATYSLPAHHLVTHGVCVGMTGSGKTGLCMVLVEECLRARVPVLVLDVKGDLANLLFTFPGLSAEEFTPWMDADAARRQGTSPEVLAGDVARRWREGLAAWSLGPADIATFQEGVAIRVITPGTTAGESLHVLSALESPGALWGTDEEAAREALSAALALVLRMVGRDGDAARSREHVLLALLAERRLRAGRPAGLEALLGDLRAPPIERVGALSVEEFLPEGDRAVLARELNTLVASPTFGAWRQGAALDVGAWLAPRQDARTPAVIVSVAHLEDAERMLVLSLVLEQTLAWVRGLPGTSELRALVLFDEVYGFIPPHPSAPPTKRPLMSLMKQARAFGVGVVLATQNPMDLDYKALSNAGVWFIGRLQTDADRERVVEGLAGTGSALSPVEPAVLSAVLKSLPPRTFHVRSAHDPSGACLLETRWTLAWLRGPLTRGELRRLVHPVTPAAPAGLPPAPSRSHMPASPGVIPITRAMAAMAVPARPDTPAGWRVWYAAVTEAAAGPRVYHPWVAATVVAHVRDARLGIVENRTVRALAPLGPDGRVVLAQARTFDPRWFTATEAPPGSSYAPLPDALPRKGGALAVERALREEVYRTFHLDVMVHRTLGLAQTSGEEPSEFVRRCQLETQRRAELARTEALARHAPRIERATARVQTSRTALSSLAEASPVGGFLATTAAMIAGNRRALRRLETQQDRLAVRRERTDAALTEALADLKEVQSACNTELAVMASEATRTAADIETRTLSAKRADIEVVEIGIAWVPGTE